MVRTKNKNVYRIKRKGKQFSGKPRHAKKLKETVIESKIIHPTPSPMHDSLSPDSDISQLISASKRKMNLPVSSKDSSSESSD